MNIYFGNVPIYGIAIITSIIVNCIVAYYLGVSKKIDKKIVLGSIVYEIIGMILGAKILNFIQVKETNSIFYAGFSAYGGVIGSIVFLIIYCKLYNVNIKDILNIYIALLPLLYSISKLGCFFMGCCYGIEYSGLGSVIYLNEKHVKSGIALFPIQLIESITNFIIFLYVIKIYKKDNLNNNIIGIVFLLCGIAKFILEFFRDSWNNKISSTQCISIFFIFLGIVIIFNKKCKKQ